MPEEYLDDQSSQTKADWQKYWAVARRRGWYFVVPFFLGWVLVWGASWLMPSVYRSSTLILVERPATMVVQNTMSQDIQSRLDSITQQVLSRTRLLHIITSLNLYANERSRGRLSDDELIDRMRKNIDIELVRSSDRELTSFNIYFSSPDPDMAQQVTAELTNVLISENLEATQSDLDNQVRFVDSQLEEARKKLTVQEDQVRQFKDRHIGELPGQLQSNIQILAGLQSQMQGEVDALSRAKQQNAYLESLIGQYTNVSRGTKPGDSGPVGLPAIDQELDRLRAQLTDLSARYTDQHPDVRKVREQIARTEKTRAQLIADLKNKPVDSSPSTDTDYSGRDGAPMMEVRSQLKANQLEITNRQRSVDNLQAQIGSYQGRLNSTPVREQELADLTRDYDQSRTYYDSLLAKKNQLELAANLSRQQQGEHFRMIDPPSRPTKPFSPNRFKLSLLGLFVGLAFGAVVAGGAEFLDDRVYDENTFRDLIPAEVMVEIPPLPTAQEQQKQRQLLKIGIGAAGFVGLVIMMGTAYSYLHG